MKKDIFGLSDPYVLIYQEILEESEDIADIEATNIIGRTDTEKKTLNPSWDQTFETEVDQFKEVIVFEVFDENRITRDDFLGRASIQLASLENDNIHEKTFKLEGMIENTEITGDLMISFEFLSKQEREMSRQRNWMIEIVQKHKLENQMQILTGNVITEVVMEFNDDQTDDFCFDTENKILKNTNFLTKVQLGNRLLTFLFETSDIAEDDTTNMNAGFHKLLSENMELVPRILDKLGKSDALVLSYENLLMKCFKTGNKEPKYIDRIKTLVLPKFRSKIIYLYRVFGNECNKALDYYIFQKVMGITSNMAKQILLDIWLPVISTNA